MGNSIRAGVDPGIYENVATSVKELNCVEIEIVAFLGSNRCVSKEEWEIQ